MKPESVTWECHARRFVISDHVVGREQRPFSTEVPAELLEVFAQVPDPRLAQGRGHQLATVLALAGMAVIAGSRSVAAIGQWAQDLGDQALSALGLGGAPASLATFDRVLRGLDVERFDAIIYAWSRLQFTTEPDGGRRVIAADGRTVRGVKDERKEQPPHLLSAFDHTTAATIEQAQVGAKTNDGVVDLVLVKVTEESQRHATRYRS